MNFDLFDSIPSGEQAFRRRYWEQKNKHPDQVTKWTKDVNNATVEVVLKKEKPDQDKVKDFYDAQRELAKNILPEQCKSATVELSEMQLRNMNEFSDQAFKVPMVANKIYHQKCGHYTDLKYVPKDEKALANLNDRVKDDYCFTCKVSLGDELNPKPDFINFKKKEDEIQPTPSQAFDVIYPMPFGCTNPPHPATKPTSSLPEGSLANNPSKETFHEMQRDNTIDYIGDKYLPHSTQDGKPEDYKPPQFQLSSSNESSNLLSISWDANTGLFDGGFQDGIGKQNTEQKPFGINVGDELQAFLIKRSVEKRAEKQSIDDQIKTNKIGTKIRY